MIANGCEDTFHQNEVGRSHFWKFKLFALVFRAYVEYNSDMHRWDLKYNAVKKCLPLPD